MATRKSDWIFTFLLATFVTACRGPAAMGPSPTSASGSEFAISRLASSLPGCGGALDTVSNLEGVVSERTPDGIQPIAGAVVELFLADRRDSENIADLEPVKATVTRSDGKYLICLPVPTGGTGGTGPGGQPFDVLVRKDGYQTASASFRFAYSVWDYGSTDVSLELVRK
jgi:hypothetical protein